MTTYPFSRNPQEDILPKNDSIILVDIIKDTRYLIEFDFDVIKEYFPELYDKEDIMSFVNKVKMSIAQISVTSNK